ncbi:bifunctional hydroxymethylpyrimidine kinase/phosphomethylpyrimidine kinase [Arsenicicoccus piscis]|uniref:Hydroxymethylpyrimidine/phosphomethylpyrimidine kinase n=1 Tax=Arsenicicoccus piscis TaxID=673954 RepID=A0ABQ6HQY4_9MICO|nr:bifunctional hydroxymethylpyrimidine kinase/phosphomethylpyrimidine kinase [Arsenicicoccus piscis]MCH8626277.1 bifunctional hydroxymethylpyrimidine kinase/phosphomethylpyrimidine kinase [Arsenicicoccus piscis]GMA20874.1 hydroxymethylpyrimidine/phosphomethylpyrimidine kinase [Arsenicicoccus piscis]
MSTNQIQTSRALTHGQVPTALSIAGSDPSGGAGIQADLKTFSALGVYGMCAITALTAQNTRGVTGVHVPPAAFLRDQLDALAADVRIDAIKIGMLADAEVVTVVSDWLDEFLAARTGFDAVVLDPVMVATSGDRLLDEAAVAAVRELVPRASIITPNLPEAAVLLDAGPATSIDEMRSQATGLVAAGARRVLLKGGHRTEDRAATDVLADGSAVHEITGRHVDTEHTHGTGCTLSSALAALRPQRAGWLETVQDAKAWLTGALEAADVLQVGHGHGPVHHFHELWAREDKTQR